MKKIFMKDFQFKIAISDLVDQIRSSELKYDYIVGIARGGAIPAVYLSHRLELPVHIMTWSTRDTKYALGNETNCWIPEDLENRKRLLLVEDIIDTGESIKTLLEDWKKSVFKGLNTDNVDICTLFYNKSNQYEIEAKYFANEHNPDNWITFPWEI